MDIEQLQLIIDLARDAGQGAIPLLVLWVLKPYFGIAVWAGLLAFIISKVIHTVREGLLSTELLRLSGARSDYNGDWSRSDKNKLREAARKTHPNYQED